MPQTVAGMPAADRGAAQGAADPAARRGSRPEIVRQARSEGRVARWASPDWASRVGEAVDRPQDPLVVGGRGRARHRAEGPHHGRRGDALEPRQAHVAVHVMAVGRVDVVAQPDPRVGEVQLGASPSQPAIVVAALGAAAAAWCSSPSGRAGERQLFEQRLGEAVVVVAGDEHDLAAGHRLAELLEERAGRVERRGQRQFAQLEDVAEQDEAVGAGDLLEQRRAGPTASRARSSPKALPRCRSETIAVRIERNLALAARPVRRATLRRMSALSDERLAPSQRDRARLPGGRRPRRRAAAADHGPRHPDARLGRGVLRDARRARLPRRSASTTATSATRR